MRARASDTTREVGPRCDTTHRARSHRRARASRVLSVIDDVPRTRVTRCDVSVRSAVVKQGPIPHHNASRSCDGGSDVDGTDRGDPLYGGQSAGNPATRSFERAGSFASLPCDSFADQYRHALAYIAPTRNVRQMIERNVDAVNEQMTNGAPQPTSGSAPLDRNVTRCSAHAALGNDGAPTAICRCRAAFRAGPCGSCYRFRCREVRLRPVASLEYRSVAHLCSLSRPVERVVHADVIGT